jgi:serine/threonine protein kinase
MADYKPSDFKNLTLGKKLGAGTFGTVYVGLLNDGRYVAVKQLDIEEDEAEDEDAAYNKEVDVHSSLSHPHIIRYLHSEPVNKTQLNVYLEIVTGGSLTSIMRSLPDNKLPLPVAKVYARHMFLGLQYLHRNGVAHRDIKGENILVSQDSGLAKLADFDQAKVVAGSLTMRGGGQNAKTLAGTPFWIAPEVITQEDGYDPFKADVWSAGCTVAEMVTGHAPWKPMSSPMAVMIKLASSTGWPDAIPTTAEELGSEDLHSFLSMCFERDAVARPDCTALLQHPFLEV